MGRVKYKKDFPEILRHYAELRPDFSASPGECAAVFGVQAETVRNWMNQHPDFRQAIDDISFHLNLRVENALLKTACGYEYTEVKDVDGSSITKTTKLVPGNVAAQKFWLTNRSPDRWKDKVEQELTTAGGQPIKPLIIFGTPDDDTTETLDTSEIQPSD